jgi:type 1 glutamine amidotransferase
MFDKPFRCGHPDGERNMCCLRIVGLFLIVVWALCWTPFARADDWDDLLGPEALGKLSAAMPAKAPAQPTKPRKVLVFAESKQDFDRMATQKGQKPVPHKSAPHAAKAIAMLGERTGAFTARLEARPAVFRENLRQFDAIVLANVFLEGKLFRSPRDFTVPEENRFAQEQKALLEYVQGGGGLVGIHLAAAEAPGWPEFNHMLGGTYAGQAWQAFHKTPVKLDDPLSPLIAAFGGKGFTVADDIYMFREQSLREAARVLLSVDTAKAPSSMWADRPDGDYPLSWIRKHGDGRVFYTALGHEPEMYFDRAFLTHLLAGVQFAVGDLQADATPGKALPAKTIEKMPGWTALFDGKDISAFQVDDEQKKHWIVSDGLLRYDGRAKTLWTKEPLADFQLRVDWRMPRVADSGVFLRGTGKAQLNNWCWDPGSGQLWGYNISPKMKADKPVGEWNTFLITMKGDRLTLELNGQEVFTEQQLKGIPPSGPIGLQQHGDPIEWKNIYFKKLPSEAR